MRTRIKNGIVIQEFGDYYPPDKVRVFKLGDKVKHSAQYIKNITFDGRFSKKFIENAKKDRGVVVFVSEAEGFVFVKWNIGLGEPFFGKTGSIHTSNIVKSR